MVIRLGVTLLLTLLGLVSAFNVVQITDAHLDLRYVEDGMTKILPSYCRVRDPDLPAQFAAPFGRPGCDLPKKTLQELLSEAKNVVPNPEVVMLNGDYASHGSVDAEMNLQESTTALNMIREAYPNAPFLISVGNNDVFPSYTVTDDFRSQLAERWADFLPNDAARDSFAKGLYYSYDHGRIRFILLNTIIYSFRDTDVESDPLGQFQFLKEQIESMPYNMQACLIGHIPPGIVDLEYSGHKQMWHDSFTQKFLDILKTYRNRLFHASFWGHIHRDSFKQWHVDDDVTQPVLTTALVTPPGSPVSRSNPAFGVLDFDFDSLLIRNFARYYSNLHVANTHGKMVFKKEYDFVSLYQLPDISAPSMAVFREMLTSDFDPLDSKYTFAKYALARTASMSWKYMYTCSMDFALVSNYELCLQQRSDED